MDNEREQLAVRVFNDCFRAVDDYRAVYGIMAIVAESTLDKAWADEDASVYLHIGDDHTLVFHASYVYQGDRRTGELRVFRLRPGKWIDKLHEIAEALNEPIDDAEIWDGKNNG